MNKSNQVYEYIKRSLIEWRPYDENQPLLAGYNDTNVRDVIMGGIPGINNPTFDYVYINETSRVDSGLTTGTNRTKQSRQTYTIDCYHKRASGMTVNGKRSTLAALNENVSFISDLLTSQGFSVMMSPPDYDYSGNGTARRTITATRTFITN